METKSSTASSVGEELSDAIGIASGNTPGASSSCPAGKNSVRNARQKDNLRAKCVRSVARAESLADSLKHELEENSVLRAEKAQAEEFIASLKRDMALAQDTIASLRRENETLRAALAARGSSVDPVAVADTAALGATVHDLDKCIQSMDSS